MKRPRPPSPAMSILGGYVLVLLCSNIFSSVQSLSAAVVPLNNKILFPYQSKGVERLVADKRVLLADEMGLGKTIQAISALNQLVQNGEMSKTEARVLIISPKSVLHVWQDELEEWLDPSFLQNLDIQLCTAGSSPEDPLSKGVIQLINYDICFKHKELLQAMPFDVLICDEAHYLKSSTSKRTKAILGNVAGTKTTRGISSRYLWLLTGTPIMNRPVELYPLLHALDPQGWETQTQFIERYCEPKVFKGGGGNRRRRWGVNANGATNLGELQNRLTPYMIRRYKTDVLTDLPPKLRSCVTLDGGSTAASIERQMVADMMTGMGTMTTMNDNVSLLYDRNTNTRGSGAEEENGLLGLESFGAEASTLVEYGIKPSDFEDERFLGALAKIRKETALLKLDPAVAMLKDIIVCEKVVVFAHHRQIVLELVERFGSQCVHIIGGMESDQRAEAIQRFQTDDNCRIFVGSIRAAGVGVTLTAASHVVFLEMDWSPATMAQAEDRCHRVGQQDSVLCQYYVFRNTIDEWVARQLIAKEVVTTMALPTDTDVAASISSSSSQTTTSRGISNSLGYVFDFGKHQNLRLEDVPEDYIKFLLSKDVWRNRPTLWRALHARGLVREEPPPAAAPSSSSKNVTRNRIEHHYQEDNESSEPSSPTKQKVEYTFNFGKHSGKDWDDVPISYRRWIVENGVWKSRSNLKRALQDAGIL
eukprot:CAMPEP_0195302020 /NCGR_PEP_ID=MMETSP0707-20130614/30344_1 /TAXON_ID=33640 /ORGANISM="Asterionellopsis glacialis, Strain CCMP134" /LENGTH=703 /DNA_ID=CAMNT_0040365147 /DNA_START=105 /DNA_END=2216 /DNA_ORIENTATION=+